MESLLRRAREEIASVTVVYRFLEEAKMKPEETDEAMWWVHRTVRLVYEKDGWHLSFLGNEEVIQDEREVVASVAVAIDMARRQWEQTRLVKEIVLLKNKWVDMVFWLCHKRVPFTRNPGEFKIDWKECSLESRIENGVVQFVVKEAHVHLFYQPKEAAEMVAKLLALDGDDSEEAQMGAWAEQQSASQEEPA